MSHNVVGLRGLIALVMWYNVFILICCEHSTQQLLSDRTTQTPHPQPNKTGSLPPKTKVGKLHIRRQGNLLHYQHFQTY